MGKLLQRQGLGAVPLPKEVDIAARPGWGLGLGSRDSPWCWGHLGIGFCFSTCVCVVCQHGLMDRLTSTATPSGSWAPRVISPAGLPPTAHMMVKPLPQLCPRPRPPYLITKNRALFLLISHHHSSADNQEASQLSSGTRKFDQGQVHGMAGVQ